jgi:hypothetical protein
VSGVIALAKPRRIKASHRRRRRVASDHLLYILNNPLSGTDPTGYTYKEACSHPGNLCTQGTAAGADTPQVPTSTGSHIPGISCAYCDNSGVQAYQAARGNGASGGQSAMGASSRQNQSASASGKGASSNGSNCGKIDEINALRDQGILPDAAGPNGAAINVEKSLDATGKAANEVGQIAKEEVKNPVNYIGFIGELKIALKLPAWAKRILGAGKAAEGAADIRMAGGGVRFVDHEGPSLLARALAKVARFKAGFSSGGRAVILDENLSTRGMAEALRRQGYNVRSVQEIYGTGTIDDEIIFDLARRIDARVLTRDVGRQPAKGFFELGITVDSRVRTPEGVGRILEEGLK